MLLKTYFTREKIIKIVRKFFLDQNFHEVVSYALNDSLPLEPNVYGFQTEWKTSKSYKRLHLSTSPEAHLKNMLALGIGNCYSIGHSFRNIEDKGLLHNPEFLMLEWYRKDAVYMNIMKDVRGLICTIYQETNLQKKNEVVKYQEKKINLDNWQEYSLSWLFQKFAKISLEDNLDDLTMKKSASNKGYSVTGASWEQLFNQIFLNEIEPQLGPDPVFITAFPSRISPLCKKMENNPSFSERFEFYLGGLELGNGNTENTDIEDINKSFSEEKKGRIRKRQIIPPIDDGFLRSLEKMQQKSYAGIGLGLDRLAMIFANSATIEDLY